MSSTAVPDPAGGKILQERHRRIGLEADLQAQAVMWTTGPSKNQPRSEGTVEQLVRMAWCWSPEDFDGVTIKPVQCGKLLMRLEVMAIGEERLQLPVKATTSSGG